MAPQRTSQWRCSVSLRLDISGLRWERNAGRLTGLGLGCRQTNEHPIQRLDIHQSQDDKKMGRSIRISLNGVKAEGPANQL